MIRAVLSQSSYASDSSIDIDDDSDEVVSTAWRSPTQPSETSTGEEDSTAPSDVVGVHTKLERALKSEELLSGLRARFVEFRRSSQKARDSTLVNFKMEVRLRKAVNCALTQKYFDALCLFSHSLEKV